MKVAGCPLMVAAHLAKRVYHALRASICAPLVDARTVSDRQPEPAP
jgi:hypothetical protein